MGLSDVKKELRKLDKDKLINLISDLYTKNKSVKEFLDFYATPNENELFNKYRNKVYEAFYPKRGFNYNLKDGKQAITDFKKLGTSSQWIADIMLFYVETGVQFTNDFGDINEPFYSSMESTYLAALKFMKSEALLDTFYDRASKIIDNTINIGWGFHDCLIDIYYQFYDDE